MKMCVAFLINNLHSTQFLEDLGQAFLTRNTQSGEQQVHSKKIKENRQNKMKNLEDISGGRHC